MQSLAALPVRPTTREEDLRRELQYMPTHAITEDGITPIEARRLESPSRVLVALMEEPVLLMTAVEWSGMAAAGQVDIMLVSGISLGQMGAVDVLDVLPEQTKLWLTGWQQQVNDGSCWRTSGSIGRQAAELIQQGFLLLSKEPTTDWANQPITTRDRATPGSTGTADWVRTVMGERYLEWISTI